MKRQVRFAYLAQVLQKRVWWFQMTQREIKLKQRMQALQQCAEVLSHLIK